MTFLKPEKLNFKLDFFQNRTIYPFYDKILNKTNKQKVFVEKSDSQIDFKNKVYVVNDIPPYFDLKINDRKIPLKAFKIHQFSGFLANLEDYQNIEDYMNDQFGIKSRSKMRAYVRRLETCFDIHYKIFYEKITIEEFQFLFDRFLLLIKKRFSQRGDTHQSLKKWDIIMQTAYPMILDKKASLFVIYDNEKPIDICLNYHHQNIMYNSIRSYDIDYSKFRLGYIDILKQLDWCFKNNYKVFDLGRGDLDYKRRWCNVVYDFEHHIIYQKNYLDKRILAFTSTKFYVLKEFLKKKEIHILYHKVKFIFKKKPQNKTKYAEHTFEINDIIKIPLNEKILKIDIDSEEYSFLRKPVYDFQYINFESSIDVTLFKIKDVYDSYLIIGKNKQQIITDKTAQDQNKSLNNTN